MTEPVNLKRFRKRKQRAADARAADATRAREGVSKAERESAAKAEALRAKRIDGAKRESSLISGEQDQRQRARGELGRDPRPKGK